MPIAQIEVKKTWPDTIKNYLIGAIHSAMVEALKIPENDRCIRFIEPDPSECPPPLGVADTFTLVEISFFQGRSIETKRALYQGIVHRFRKIGIEPDDIRIVLNEISLNNWEARGGVPAREIDYRCAANA